MTPVEITQGKSFKGLSAYLLQDENRETADRVGWTQTLNLSDAPADQAWCLMLATANSANALKEASGIKKGKTPVKVVHHFSLNFHPDDEVTPEIMSKAVREALEVYGMEHHQALAVEHHDKAHRHVHVMVNLIDPENGMSAATPVMGDDGKKRSKLSNSQRRLSSWAQKFERNNGLEITEGRLANANKRAQGEQVDAKRKKRNQYDHDKRFKADRRKGYKLKKFEDEAKAIQQRSKELKEQQRHEWDALKQSYGEEKEAIRRNMSPAMKERVAEIKETYKPFWAELFKEQSQERFRFDQEAETAKGRLFHSAKALREMVRDGNFRGLLGGVFSKEVQRDLLMKRQDAKRSAFGREIRAVINQAMNTMKEDFDRQFSDTRERFLSDCSDLKERHDEDWKEIRQAWKDHNSAKRDTFTARQDRADNMSQGQSRGAGRGRSMTP